MSARTHTVKWIRQSEINDIFEVVKVATGEVEYLTYPRTMAMTEADLLEDYEIVAEPLTMIQIAERMAFSILDGNPDGWADLLFQYKDQYPGICHLAADLLDEIVANENMAQA
jgi:hypothetical protein